MNLSREEWLAAAGCAERAADVWEKRGCPQQLSFAAFLRLKAKAFRERADA